MQGGLENVVSMFTYLVQTYLPGSAAVAGPAAEVPGPPIETPPLGCLHPAYQGGARYFGSPAEYMAWWVWWVRLCCGQD